MPNTATTHSDTNNALRCDRVTVIVPTFNRANYIAECLDSLLRQTMQPHEIIVIDDGSEDDTPQVLEAYGDKIHYIRKENGGKPTAVNLGLSVASGDLIWIFDDDDVALPNAIKDRVATLIDHPDAGFVYSQHYLGEDGTDGHIVQGKLHNTPYYDQDHFLYELMKGCFFHLGSALVSIEVYRTVGLFASHMLSSEDYDMQIRIAHHATGAFCASPTFIFRQHTGSRGSKDIRYSSEKRQLIFMKHDRIIGQQLRANNDLGDYLQPRLSEALDPYQRRQALLSRMVVMASKGCMTEMLADLQLALEVRTSPAKPLTRAERERIRDVICTGYAYPAFCADRRSTVQQLIKLKSLPEGRHALRSFSYGMLKYAKSYPASLLQKATLTRLFVYLMIQSFT